MSYPALKILLLILASASLMVCSSSGFASGGGGHGEAKKEEKKEEKKEGEGKKVKSTEDSFVHVQHSVQTFEAKIKSGKDELEHLIHEKMTTKDPKRVAEIIKEMIKTHKEIEKNIKEYDLQRSLLKYRYPEKGRSERRTYERIELQPLEEIEGQVDLSTHVKQTLKRVRSQYETPQEVEQNIKAGQKKKNITDPYILKH